MTPPIADEATKACQVCGYITKDWHQVILSQDDEIKLDTTLCADHTDRLVERTREIIDAWTHPTPV